MNRLRIMAGCLLLGVCALQGWTQYMAYRYGYPPALGTPLWTVQAFYRRHSLYAPWAGLVWYWRWATGWQRVSVLASGSTGVLLGTAGFVLYRRRLETQPPPLEGHGTTRWATRRDITQAGLYTPTGLVLGKYHGRILRFNGPENVLLVGPQRQGKGVGVIIPSLLELQEHVVVIDVRGDTWDATAGYRSTFSRCVRLSLTQPGSGRFSLPQAIRKGTPYAFMDAALLGDMMIDPGGNKPDRDHWEKTAKALCTCGLLYEVHKRIRPTLSNMASFWSQPGRSMQQTLRYVIETAPTRQVAELAQEVLNKAGNEASGVLSSMMTQLFLFRDPLLAANTATCDFHLEDFTRHDQLTSLYIVLSPGEEEHLRPFLRMFLRLALQRWLEMGTPKHKITLVMDEFTSWGRMPFFVNNLAVLGGRGIRTLLAVQNIPQLADTYGRSDLIVEQCKVRIYFAANRQTTGKEISGQTGTGTATTRQPSYRRDGWSVFTDSENVQEQQHSRPLLTDSKATQIPQSTEVIQVTGHAPIWAKKIRPSAWTRQYWNQTWRVRMARPAPDVRRVA